MSFSLKCHENDVMLLRSTSFCTRPCNINIVSKSQTNKFLAAYLQVISNAMHTQCFRYLVHPTIFFCGKKTFQKCNPPDFKFYLRKFNNKNFPHMV